MLVIPLFKIIQRLPNTLKIKNLKVSLPYVTSYILQRFGRKLEWGVISSCYWKLLWVLCLGVVPRVLGAHMGSRTEPLLTYLEGKYLNLCTVSLTQPFYFLPADFISYYSLFCSHFCRKMPFCCSSDS